MAKFEKFLEDKRIMNLFDIDDEEKKQLLQMHKELKENNRLRQENTLKINYRLPMIYLDSKLTIPLIKKFNENKNKLVTNKQKLSGYAQFEIAELINVILPDEEDVISAIQEHEEPDMLKNIIARKDSIYNDWGSVIVHFELEEGNINKLEFYSKNTNERLAEKKEVMKITEILQYQTPEVIDWKINLDASSDIGYSLEIDDLEESVSGLLYICNVLLVMTLSELLQGFDENDKNKYRITRENINELIPKNCNENIHLNREIKQSIKKYNREVYLVK